MTLGVARGLDHRATGAVVAAGTGLVALTYGVVRFGFGLQLTQLSAQFSLTPASAGLIASGSFAAYCAVALLAQQIVQRLGARGVLWLAAGLAACGGAVVASAWSATVLAVGVLIAGGAAGAASPALVVAVSTTHPHRLQARRQAVVNAGTGVGVVAAGAAALMAPAAWRPVWALAAVAALIAAAIVDRCTPWPTAQPSPHHSPLHSPRPSASAPGLRRPAAAAALAGLGSAAVWTFGRDLLTTVGGLPETITAGLWVLLGAAAVLGALSGDAVRIAGLRAVWVLTVTLCAASTGLLGLVASDAVGAALAVAVFGGSYTALSGVLIAWAASIRPELAGATTATLFVALTAGQAAGSVLAGGLSDALGLAGTFMISAVVLLGAVLLLPRRPLHPSA